MPKNTMTMEKYISKARFLEEQGFTIFPGQGLRAYLYLVIDHNRNNAKMYFIDLKNAFECIKRWYLPTKKLPKELVSMHTRK